MPLYEYMCRACQQRLEILQRLDEGPNGLVCPGCGRKTLDKQFSTFSGAVADSSPSFAGGGCGRGRFT